MEEFARELYLMETLQSRFMPQLIYYDETKLQLFMELGLCSLEDLRLALVARGERLKDEQAFGIFAQIVVAVEILLEQNAFHSDLKPQNIMLRSRISDDAAQAQHIKITQKPKPILEIMLIDFGGASFDIEDYWIYYTPAFVCAPLWEKLTHVQRDNEQKQLDQHQKEHEQQQNYSSTPNENNSQQQLLINSNNTAEFEHHPNQKISYVKPNNLNNNNNLNYRSTNGDPIAARIAGSKTIEGHISSLKMVKAGSGSTGLPDSSQHSRAEDFSAISSNDFNSLRRHEELIRETNIRIEPQQEQQPLPIFKPSYQPSSKQNSNSNVQQVVRIPKEHFQTCRTEGKLRSLISSKGSDTNNSLQKYHSNNDNSISNKHSNNHQTSRLDRMRIAWEKAKQATVELPPTSSPSKQEEKKNLLILPSNGVNTGAVINEQKAQMKQQTMYNEIQQSKEKSQNDSEEGKKKNTWLTWEEIRFSEVYAVARCLQNLILTGKSDQLQGLFLKKNIPLFIKRFRDEFPKTIAILEQILLLTPSHSMTKAHLTQLFDRSDERDFEIAIDPEIIFSISPAKRSLDSTVFSLVHSNPN